MKKVIGAVIAVWALTGAAFAQGGPDIMILRDAGSQIGVRVTDEDGVTVAELSPDTPASRAGFKPGDVVVEFDGERIRSATQFRRVVAETPPNKAVTAIVDRNGKRQTLTVTPQVARAGTPVQPLNLSDFNARLRGYNLGIAPDARPRDAAPATAAPPRRLGVAVAGLSDQLAGYFGVKGGALVSAVDAGTPAAQAGLRSGDVITAINGEAVTDPSDVSTRVRGAAEGATLELRVTRDRKELTLKAVLPSAAPRPGRI